MKNTVKPELLPCPFCGGHNLEIANTHTPSFWVQCNDCEAQVSGGYFKGPQRDTKFSYSDDPQGPYEAGFNDLHPEYKKAALSAIHAWNNRVAPPTSTAIAARVIQTAAEVCEKWAKEADHRGYEGDAALYRKLKSEIASITPANAEAELEALMMKVAEASFTSGYDTANGEEAEDVPAIVRRVLEEKGE
jgi:hypothetical protein